MRLFLQEKQQFVKGTNLKSGRSLDSLSLKVQADYYEGMEKAFDDAFNQYARREKKKYAAEKQEWMTPMVALLFRYFNSEEYTFDACFADCIKLSKKILNNNRYGLAQKFTNMSFKYLYCYRDATEFEEKFERCHMPLDAYTIHWVKSLKSNELLKNKDILRRLNAINNAWTKIEEPLYTDIQELVADTLLSGYTYTISFNRKANNTICLPKNRLAAEFIIWHQEKINELYRAIKKAESDFERLGIQWIDDI